MKILGISGSPRERNTCYMLKTVLNATNHEYELISLKNKNIQPCCDCRYCHKNYKCTLNDDMQELYDKLLNADIIILGSPTYFSNVTGIMKIFMDRCLPFYFSRKLKNKKTGVVTVGNFEKYLEFDEKGNCKWHKEEESSVLKCLRNLETFCNHLGLKIIGSVYVLHSNPKEKKEELIQLGKKLIS